MKQFRNFTRTSSQHLIMGSDGVAAAAMVPGYTGDMYESEWETPLLSVSDVARTSPPDNDRSKQMPNTVLNKSSAFEPLGDLPEAARRVPIVILGNSLGIFIALTYVLCVLFDLWFPGLAMNAAWAGLLPGFVWISWSSFFLGLAETFAYGWYIALLFGVIYNFMLRNTGRGTAA